MAAKTKKKLHHPVREFKSRKGEGELTSSLHLTEYANGEISSHVDYHEEAPAPDQQLLDELWRKSIAKELDLEQIRDILKNAGFETRVKIFTEKETEEYYEEHPRRSSSDRANVKSTTSGRSNMTGERYKKWINDYIMLNWSSFLHDIQNPDYAAKMSKSMSEDSKRDFAEYIEEAKNGWHNKPTLAEYTWIWNKLFKNEEYDPPA